MNRGGPVALRFAAFPLLLLAATLLAYTPAFRAGFVWDDDFHVTKNPNLLDLQGLRRIWLDPSATPQYYPLTHSSFWVEYRLWGPDPLGYHVVNVLVHGLAAVLVGVVLRRLGLPGALLAAWIFALHPVHVESVAWVSERKNTLSAALGLASLAWLVSRVDEPGHGRRLPSLPGLVVAVALFVLAVLAKTVAGTLPVVVAILALWKRVPLGRRGWAFVAALTVLGAVGGALTVHLEKSQIIDDPSEFSMALGDRLAVAGRVPWFYLGKLAWPAGLSFVYPRWDLAAAGAVKWVPPALTATLLLGGWILRRRIGTGPLVASAVFLVLLSPASGIFDVYPMRYSFVADHFQYLASIAPIAAACAASTLATRRLAAAVSPPRAASIRRAGAIVAVALLAVMAVATHRRAAAFENEETLWRDTIAKNPGAWIAHNNLGPILAESGREGEALARFRDAVRLKPDHAGAHSNLGRLLARLHRDQEALPHLLEAARLRPQDASIRKDAGTALARMGRPSDAVPHLRAALGSDPDDAELWLSLGNALARSGSDAEAVVALEKGLANSPNDAAGHYDLGTVLARSGRLREALPHLERALALAPDLEGARRNLDLARRLASGKTATAPPPSRR